MALLKGKPSFNNLFTVLDVQRIDHGTLLVTLDDGTLMRIDVDRYPAGDHERRQSRREQGLRTRTNAPGVANVLRKARFPKYGSLAYGGSGYQVSGARRQGVRVEWIDVPGQPERRTQQMRKIRALLMERGYVVTGAPDEGFIVA